LPDAILSPHLKSATPINRQHAIRLRQIRVRNYALLFFGCVLFHVAGTWNVPLIDRDEPRFAEASREMIERSDYVVPYFNDRVRLDKPPLAYWMQVASYGIFGENDFAARFPSTIAAALTALSIFAWGSRLRSPRRPSASQARIGGDRTGWWAAIIFTLCLQTFVHAKAAVADMWLVLFVTLAHWSGYELIWQSSPESEHQTSNSERIREQAIEHRTSNLWWWTFYLALALAFLAKGPIGWVPLLTVGSTIIFAGESHLRKSFKFVRGIALMLAAVSVWGIPALVRTHGEFFWIGIGRHVVGRSIGAMEGHGANSLGAYLLLLPFYFVTIFASFFPWSIKLPWLTRRLWRNRDTTDNYLLTGTFMIFTIFSLIKTKLPHYTLPAFPLLALLLARCWVDNGTQAKCFKRCTIAASCVYLTIALIAAPFAARFFPAAQLFRESRNDLRSEMEFAAVEYNEPSLVWYFRGRVNGFMTPLNRDAVVPFMEQDGARFVMMPTNLVRDLFPNPPPNWKTFSTCAFNIAKGKRVDLTLVLKSD